MTNLNFRHDPILANRHKWMRIWQRKRWAYWTSTWTKPTEEFCRQFPRTPEQVFKNPDLGQKIIDKCMMGNKL